MGTVRRGGLGPCLFLLAGLAPLSCASVARAQEPFDVVGAGVFLGYSFGEPGGFEWGFDGFATRWTEDHPDCGSSDRYGFGPLLRVSVGTPSPVQVTLAAHGGGELARPYVAFDGELGGRLVLSDGPLRIVPHTGLTFESVIFDLYFRQAWLPPQLSVGGGARYYPLFGEPGMCAVGRQYRDHAGNGQLAHLRRGARFDARNPHAALWARRALEECASVPAFLQLARELADLGAPPELVTRALGAAREEVSHARDAADLATLYGGAEVRALPPPLRRRPALPRPLALRRLIRESWLDGCLNEGLSAAIAGAEANEARVAEDRGVLGRIAHEEAGHAALAFDVLRWALAEARISVTDLPLPEPGEVSSHGVTTLGRAALRELAVQNLRSAQSILTGG